jgi:hypothetical protein
MKYDGDNKYPQNIIDIINASGTTKKTLEKYANFVAGNGFENENNDKIVVNSKGETLLQLNNKIALSLSYFKGVALHFNYTILGKISEIQLVPFEYVRRMVDTDYHVINKFQIYDDWNGKKYRRIRYEDIQTINGFDLENVKNEIREVGIENYTGQILYFIPDGSTYPLSMIDPVTEDCITDSKIKVAKFRNVTTGFMPSSIIVRSKIEEDADYEIWQDNLKNFQGADEAGKIMSIEIDADEREPKILPFSTQNTDKSWEYTEMSCKQNIRECIGIPQILMTGSGVAKLGSSTEIEDAYNFVNNQTENERKLLSQLYKSIFVNWVSPINDEFKLNPKQPLYVNNSSQNKGN